MQEFDGIFVESAAVWFSVQLHGASTSAAIGPVVAMFACCSCNGDGPSPLCFGNEALEEGNADVVQKGDNKSFESVAPCHPFAAGEDDKEMAKQRLQRLIRDFAQEVVADGIPVQVLPSDEDLQEGTLRLDRKLRQVEFWHGSGATLVMPLNEVSSINKEEMDTEESETSTRSALAIISKSTEVRVLFETMMTRDRAFTCLRIFQMSVAHEAKPEVPATS